MIDQKLALSMLMHNERIYYNLLKRFKDGYKANYESLKTLFNNNDIQFFKIVHDIKGISLNLGASKLYELTNEINTLFKKEELVKEELVDKFIIELELVLKEIEEIINRR